MLAALKEAVSDHEIDERAFKAAALPLEWCREQLLQAAVRLVRKPWEIEELQLIIKVFDGPVVWTKVCRLFGNIAHRNVTVLTAFQGFVATIVPDDLRKHYAHGLQMLEDSSPASREAIQVLLAIVEAYPEYPVIPSIMCTINSDGMTAAELMDVVGDDEELCQKMVPALEQLKMSTFCPPRQYAPEQNQEATSGR
ncbi:MAG: hypothetical protein WAZ14_00785 [Patescibacteria group bacterium]